MLKRLLCLLLVLSVAFLICSCDGCGDNNNVDTEQGDNENGDLPDFGGPNGDGGIDTPIIPLPWN